MPDARLIFFAVVAAMIAACSKQPATDQNVLIDTNVPADADVEALPPDESSGTPSDQLANGDDNADVGDLGNADGNTI